MMINMIMNIIMIIKMKIMRICATLRIARVMIRTRENIMEKQQRKQKKPFSGPPLSKNQNNQ